jgi:acyl dehydratase
MNVNSPMQETRKPWYLDDLSVGLRFRSGSFLIDEQQMIDFARQFDPQPFHLDAERAKQSIFGGLVASGWFTASVSMRLLLEALPLATGTIGLGGETMQWPNPVKAGDQLHLEGEVINIRSSRNHNDRGVVTVRSSTYNQDNKSVFSNIGNLLVFRR